MGITPLRSLRACRPLLSFPFLSRVIICGDIIEIYLKHCCIDINFSHVEKSVANENDPIPLLQLCRPGCPWGLQLMSLLHLNPDLAWLSSRPRLSLQIDFLLWGLQNLWNRHLVYCSFYQAWVVFSGKHSLSLFKPCLFNFFCSPSKIDPVESCLHFFEKKHVSVYKLMH